MLLEPHDPSIVLGRSNSLLCPEAPYETNGFVPNVVFPCGAVPEEDGRIRLYYGAADNFECLAETTLEEVLSKLS